MANAKKRREKRMSVKRMKEKASSRRKEKDSVPKMKEE